MIIIFILIMLSGSFCLTVFKGKNRAEYVSETILTIILGMYFFGLIDCLDLGVYIICAVSLLLYITSVIIITKQKSWKKIIGAFFQPYIIWILAIYGLLLLINYGRLVVIYDDFDHWALCVKELWRLGGFSNETVDYAPNYPPAMALLQYFVVKTRALLLQKNDFSEWWLFMSYQFATYSMFMPILEYFKKKRLGSTICGIMLFLIPLFLFPTFMHKLYIDTFLNTLASYGIIVMLDKEMDCSRNKIALLIEICAVLTLTKDVGLIFAIGIVLTYFLVIITEKNVNIAQYKNEKVCGGILILAIFFARFSWSKKFSALGFTSATGSISGMLGLFQVKNIFRDILGLEANYHNQSFKNYVKAFFNDYDVKIGDTNISISFFWCFVILTAILYLVLSNMPKEEKKHYGLIGIGCVATLWMYIVAQGIFYMYVFPEGQAVELAAYSRYMGIAFQAFLIEVVAIVCLYINKRNVKYNKAIITLLGIICLVPLGNCISYINRDNVKSSIRNRANYYEIYAEEIRSVVNPEESIYIVNLSEDADLHWFAINYICNDIKKEGNRSGTVRQANGEEWMEYLEQNYDYVYLIEINDEFIETYGDIFDTVPDIESRSIYKVDKVNRKLCLEKENTKN